jgi:cytochrome c5
MKNGAAKLSAVAAILTASGCDYSKSTIDAAALLETRCGVCHSTGIIKNARKSKRYWQETVTRMISRGAILSPEEKKALVSYLARTYR